MKPITVTFVLTGANAGKTMQLRPDDEIKFVNGRAKYTGPVETLQFVANRVSFHGAFIMGSPELEAALQAGLVTQEQINGLVHPNATADSSRLAALQGELRSDGRGTPGQDAAERARHAESDGSPVRSQDGDGSGLSRTSGNGQDERLIKAIRRLDPSDDACWNAEGKPLVAAVASLYGNGVTRAQIDAALPGFTRDVAAL